ncbi:neprilysin-2-like [Dermacentor silvarum]|uniref:neprilysin-2-like n=1 Tax=Dermacentor silvarum TaxID=543639 RepID=UPI0021016EA0|nr:neprilysin-2-like [Dermacentor silvarum]
MFLFPSPSKAVRTFCMTEDCVKHRQLLENQLDKTIDACEDFGAYVCRQWLPRKEFAELSRSMIWDMVMSWLSRLPDTLTKSAARLPVANKAAAMFNSCVTQVGSGATVIKDFMHAHGIAWPEDPDGSIKPLEALFDLSFNWRVHLWLRLNVLAVTRHYNRRLIIVSPNDMLALWWRVFRQIPKERFDTVYRAFFKMFAKNATIRPRAQDINATQELLEIVFQTFLPAAKWNARSPKLLSLRELDRHSSVAIGERLMHSLNSVLRIDPPVTMDDLVLLSDDAILEGTFVLIGIYGDEYVLKQLSWLFMQACAVVADPAKVLVVLHGNKHHALAQLPRFCARQVEDSYKLMVSAMASVAHFADDERRRIDDFLAEIRQMALNKTLASAWLDNATSELAADKLKNVEAVLWPAEKFPHHESTR